MYFHMLILDVNIRCGVTVAITVWFDVQMRAGMWLLVALYMCLLTSQAVCCMQETPALRLHQAVIQKMLKR